MSEFAHDIKSERELLADLLAIQRVCAKVLQRTANERGWSSRIARAAFGSTVGSLLCTCVALRGALVGAAVDSAWLVAAVVLASSAASVWGWLVLRNRASSRMRDLTRQYIALTDLLIDYQGIRRMGNDDRWQHILAQQLEETIEQLRWIPESESVQLELEEWIIWDRVRFLTGQGTWQPPST